MNGKTVGVDATTLEANAALRSIVRRDTGESHQDFLTKLAHRGERLERPFAHLYETGGSAVCTCAATRTSASGC